MVRRAEEFIRDRFSEPITIADDAAAAGVNLRSLQTGFKERLGTTPRQYLMSVRLERAREMLLANGFAAITSIAYECGIMHLGRFAQAYKLKYGELPSQTLRRRLH